MTNISRKIRVLLAALLVCAGAGALQAGVRKSVPPADSMRKVRKLPSVAVRAAFRNFTQKQGAGWRIRYSPGTALPEALVGGSTVKYPGTPEQAAAAFFADNGDLLNVDPLALRLVAKKTFMGITHLQYQQYKDGLPVEFSYARVHVTDNGSVVGYQGKFQPGIALNTSPALTEPAAIQAASSDLGLPLHVEKSELVIYPEEDSGALDLAWKVRGRAAGGLWVYYIDASSGAVLLKYDDMRRACSVAWPTYGASSGTIYAISPIPTDPNSDDLTEAYWAAPVLAPLQDQYVWVNNYSNAAVTDQSGSYCSMQSGRAFSSLQGPYFSVTNFRGASAHWDNNNDPADWTFIPAPYQSPSPYTNLYSDPYTVTLPPASWTAGGKVFAEAMPHFTASVQSPFEVGEMDLGGSATDDDELYVRNPAWTNGNMAGAYIGRRTASFYGAVVADPSYILDLQTDASGTKSGFLSDGAEVLLFPQNNTANNATGSIVWAPGNTGISFMDTDPAIAGANRLSEVNAFYHLNKVHHYFDPINIDPNNGNRPAADLSKRIAVMVHAHGAADTMSQTGGMLNGFYDLEHDNIMLGDGPLLPGGEDGSYRSFALDGTIIRHEYTHSVVNRIYPIINFGEFGALSEAVADYFSLASFWKDGVDVGGSTITVLGNFIGANEATARDLSGAAGVKLMPADWHGEVHDDSLILSQALYDLHFNNPRDGTASALGTFSAGPFAGQYKADVLLFAALFYFPDNFSNLYDAMVDACAQIDTKWGSTVCDHANTTSKISSAFAVHDIGPGAGGDSYEKSPTSKLCLNNNGPECATDISTMSALSATIYPSADVDYYSLPLSAGDFAAKLDLPLHNSDPDNPVYEAYSMLMFDSDRNIVSRPDGSQVIALPHIDLPVQEDVCGGTDPCYTYSPAVTLNYSVPKAGRYYLVVSATLNDINGNSTGSSQLPYTLTLSRSPSGTATAGIVSRAFDHDQITFTAPYEKFAAEGWPSSATVATSYPDLGTEMVFQYAQLRDQDYAPIGLTRTDLANSYLKVNSSGNTTSNGVRVISGIVQLQTDFSARYRGVGTVYLEVFGRNHMGSVVSLGVSNAINLTAGAAEADAYNNIITAAGNSALIRYAVVAAGSLSIKVYTQTGALVRTVYSGPVPAGKGSYEWDGTNSSGARAASGIYFVKVEGPGLDKVVKVAVVR